jgi:hypothetical protein
MTLSVDGLKVGDRVRFDNSICMGYGELGTISKIEYEVLDGLKYPVVWIRWDCHGKEIGDLCFDGILREWVLANDTGLSKWLEV